jgi:CRISPR/Cas system CSM-associated protein Csm3 (group 7 of RAMP superfamily)
MTRELRLLCFGIIELQSSLHVGGNPGGDTYSDQPILRDVAGIPFISGGALAGAFAACLDSSKKEKWLGITSDKKTQKDTPPSLVTFNDVYPLPAQRELLTYPVEIRDGVTIMRRSLTAKEDHHFQTEVLPVGTAFPFFCRADLACGKNGTSAEFKNKMEQFLLSGGSFGGKTNAGNGRWQVQGGKIGWLELDMSSVKDLRFWLRIGHGYQWAGDWEQLKTDLSVEPVDKKPVENQQWEMELTIKVERGFHLSAAGTGLPEKDHADLTQALRQRMTKKTNGFYKLDSEYVDYGSAVKGRLRTAMEMLLRTYLRKQDLLDENKILAIVPDDPAPAFNLSICQEIRDFFGHRGKKGGWAVEEAVWNKAGTQRQDHIRLSEFTQHVIHGAKFEFEPLSAGETRVVVNLPAEAPEWQKALVWRAGKLLTLNILPWGGHGSRGYVGATFVAIMPKSIVPGVELRNKVAVWKTVESKQEEAKA